MSAIEELTDLLKAGSVKDIYQWQAPGLIAKPKTPYCVIKESATVTNYKTFHIFCHFAIGKPKELAEYVNCELISLISAARNAAGQCRYRFTMDKRTPATEEAVVDAGDNTLRGGRMVHLPVVYA